MDDEDRMDLTVLEKTLQDLITTSDELLADLHHSGENVLMGAFTDRVALAVRSLYEAQEILARGVA